MKTFLQNLEEELRKNNLKEEEIKEIIADHTEMIESAIKEGLSDSDLEGKFGNPSDLANELSQFSDKENNETKEKTKVKMMEFEDVKEHYSIAIGLISEDLEFEFNEDNKIIVKYYGKHSLNDYVVTFEDNVFTLKSPKKLGRGFNFFGLNESNKFKISIPKGLTLDAFRIKEVNGDFSVGDITVKEFVIETTNGDVELHDLKLGKFKTGTINGDMKISNVSCQVYNASMISGDISIEGLLCEKDIFVHTVSGDIEINNSSCNEATLKTISGDLAGTEFYPKALSLSSVSGDVSIKNKDASKPIEIKHKKSVSGDIEIITK